MRLCSATPATWFDSARRDLAGLLSDHLHCERKAAENALGLVRRYPHDPRFVDALTRLAHEETSHCIQVAELMAERGLRPRADTANVYARRLLALVRPREPERRLDALLVSGFIEARSHERLQILAHGFSAQGETRLGDIYRALANAEDRHAEIFVELAALGAPMAEVEARAATLGIAEAEILAELPHGSRVH